MRDSIHIEINPTMEVVWPTHDAYVHDIRNMYEKLGEQDLLDLEDCAGGCGARIDTHHSKEYGNSGRTVFGKRYCWLCDTVLHRRLSDPSRDMLGEMDNAEVGLQLEELGVRGE